MHSYQQKIIALVFSFLSTAAFAVTDFQFFGYAQANYPEVRHGPSRHPPRLSRLKTWWERTAETLSRTTTTSAPFP
ncbi:MAG: hypothetical protein CFE44_24620 [Burkholderiales bacterium PBB4]|nr:MAG: hypothetical protein CFE44_24620 [Burkholderiales bacterium PBB4]